MVSYAPGTAPFLLSTWGKSGKKLWTMFFELTDGLTQKFRQSGEKKLNGLNFDIRQLCRKRFQKMYIMQIAKH